MSNDYEISVLYKADIEHELLNRAAGVDATDYVLVDRLCEELINKCIQVFKNVHNEFESKDQKLYGKTPQTAVIKYYNDFGSDLMNYEKKKQKKHGNCKAFMYRRLQIPVSFRKSRLVKCFFMRLLFG